MSDYKCVQRAASTSAARATSTSKPSKPFCSLAYLAKSTAAINSSSDVRILKGPGQNSFTDPSSPPNVAATAKVNERGSPGLPTGTATAIREHGDNSQQPNEASTTSRIANGRSSNNLSSEQSDGINHSRSIAEVFGVINEEDATPTTDQVDGTDVRRPWELGAHNGFVRRIPPSLMTPANAQNGFPHCSNGLASLSKLNSMDCWDYTIELECLNGPQDLQLAAELGKTLLERNKELESLVKELKGTIDEQQQEIVYLKKHTTALREVNDTRLKVYEQLDIGIQDLERANQRLTAENTSDKKHIKTLVQNIEALEARQDELNKQLEELRQALSMERRKNERLSSANERRNAADDSHRNNGVLDGSAVEEPTSTSNSNESSSEVCFEANTTAPENCSFAFRSTAPADSKANSTSIGAHQSHDNSMALSDLVCSADDGEEIIKLVNDLEMTKKAFLAEQQRCTELEEQLVAIIQENQMLQSRLANNSPNEEMRSMQEELSVLDEVRQGKMCSRCMRVVEERGTIGDEQSSLAPTEEYHEDEERSLLDNGSECSQAAYRPGVSIKVSQRIADSLDLSIPSSPNPYRELVEKYEALLEVQCSAIVRKSTTMGGAVGSGSGSGGDGMSLADEFQSSGEFSQSQKSHTLSSVADETAADESCGAGSAVGSSSAAEVHNGGDSSLPSSNDANTTKVVNNTKDMRGRTPTEYSEAETSSSGYADETSNKSTQTENRPGSFLCTIGDGEVCKFSIYDDASPIESHFRNRPEYKELFKEIFAVLKKAATNKEEGERLPLLDDTEPAATSTCTAAKVPPVTPANEELPIGFEDDAQSIISSAVSEQSFAMSECITKLERKTAKKHIIEKNQENQPPSLLGTSITTLVVGGKSPIVENGRVLTPLKREPLEYLSVGVGIKKKNRRKNRNFSGDRSESPATLPSPPRFFIASGKKRRDVRPYVQSPLANTSSDQPRSSRSSGGAHYEWSGNSMVIYNRSLNSPGTQSSLRGREMDLSNLEYRPSFLSRELNQLKNLEMSYAEVLRSADSCKHSHCQSASHHHHHHHSQQQQQQHHSQQKQHKQQKLQRNRKN
uniref:Cerebellar degeneration-related protein 2-like protein n=1 Tax=Bactrocera dorsalis TaxID=27457 RepID=A0A034VIJ5_BACDO